MFRSRKSENLGHPLPLSATSWGFLRFLRGPGIFWVGLCPCIGSCHGSSVADKNGKAKGWNQQAKVRAYGTYLILMKLWFKKCKLCHVVWSEIRQFSWKMRFKASNMTTCFSIRIVVNLPRHWYSWTSEFILEKPPIIETFIYYK